MYFNIFPEHDQDIPDKITVLKSAVDILVHDFCGHRVQTTEERKKAAVKGYLGSHTRICERIIVTGAF